MTRQDEADAPARKKRRGRRKSKAERLARAPAAASSSEDLEQLLRGSSSRDWDAAQCLALRVGTTEARATVVRVILHEREAPRAAAHYAKRLELRGDALLAAIDPALAPLRLAQFLVELDEYLLATSERLQRFVWPWLTDKTEENQTTLKAAVHLMLHPTASEDLKVQDKKERGLRLQRTVVTQCLKTGKLLHLVPTHSRAFAGCMAVESVVEMEEEEEDIGDTELLRRQQVANRVQKVLQLLWPDARVLLFGSSVTGLLDWTADEGKSDADVDLCVLLPSAPQFRQETAPLVTEVKEHLMLYLLPNDSEDSEQHVTAVTRARIPIVNFRDPVTDLPCDLCVNNVSAIWNTRLVRWFLYGSSNADTSEKKQLWHVRRLCRWLREWRQVKKRVVGGALSSYGLLLLVLYYLQRSNVLPVLDCSAHVVEDEDALRVLKEESVDEQLEKMDKSFVSVKDADVQDWRALRRKFFHFYTCEFDYEHTVVSLRTKDIMSKTSKSWSRQNDSRLCLEDPVETERDLGVLCSRRAFGRLRCAFAQACIILSRKEEDLDSNSMSEAQNIETELLTPWAYEDDEAVGEDSNGTPSRRDKKGFVRMTVAKGDTVGNRTTAKETREAERRVKLQHFLVLRAFNLRRPKETLHQQFQFLKKRVENSNLRKSGDFLELDEVCAYLSIPPFRRLLLVQVFGLGPEQTQLNFHDFVYFLQSAAVRAAREERQQADSSLPPPPPRSSRTHQVNETLVTFNPSRTHDEVMRAPPAPGLWKKREITIQEKITEYTKIDEKGQPQRLVEKERHQTEVLHMESLDGEFAHREITQFEQTEHLNDEMVHLDHGREEFLHLKSRHDEISRFESSVPPGGPGGGRPEECEQQPPSPTIKRDPFKSGTAHESTGFGYNSSAEAEAEDGYQKRWDHQAPEEDVQQT